MVSKINAEHLKHDKLIGLNEITDLQYNWTDGSEFDFGASAFASYL